MKLSQSTVNSLTLPPGKIDVVFYDDHVHGRGLRIRAGGKRVWIFQYKIGKKHRRMTLGMSSAISLAAAQKTASDPACAGPYG